MPARLVLYRVTDDSQVLRQRLTLPVALEDGRVPIAFKQFCYVASGLLLAVLIWASIAEIREFAIAPGTIIPAGSVKQVYHLEGGQIETILVAEGQFVKKGDVLIRLNPKAAESDLGQLKVRKVHLTLQKQRLEALLSGHDLKFGSFATSYPGLTKSEIKRFQTEREANSKEIQTLRTKIAQRRAEFKSSSAELKSLSRQLEIHKEQLSIRKKTLDRGYTSRVTYLDVALALETAKSRIAATEGKIASIREQLSEAESQLQEARLKMLKEDAKEHSRIAGELAELNKMIEKHQDRRDRLQIRAPAAGIIHELIHKTPGAVVKPNELVAKIVPMDGNIVVEAQIEPSDIGHIQVGQEAEVEISTFDRNVFGTVTGTVKTLSATTFERQNGTTYYKAIIALEKNTVGSSERQRAILPGMVVKTTIVTGSKSIVRYFLKPVYRSLDTAFSER